MVVITGTPTLGVFPVEGREKVPRVSYTVLVNPGRFRYPQTG